MPFFSIATQDVLATSVFLGGAIFILSFALFSYMGLLPFFSSKSATTFYSGKHVLITGGSSGIGKELAGTLLAYGATVTLVARNATRLLDAATQLEPPDETHATSSRLNVFPTDCSDLAAVNTMVDHVEHHFGPVDILVNCAGCAVGGYFETLDPTIFRQQMDSNYFSHIYPSHALFKRMALRRSGHIVFVSSMAGQTGVFGQAAYCPTKFAVRGLAETLYFEGKPYNINVTVVFPPDTDTPGLHAERDTMPPETQEISNTGGLFSAESVAGQVAKAVMRNRFRVCFGVVGKLLGVLTAGLTPGVSLVDVLLAPITRAVTPIFIWDQNRTISRGHTIRQPIGKGNNAAAS